MEPNTLENNESDKKPLNIVLLGDESSEKEKLMSKFLLLNSPQFQENEIKNEEDKEEDVSIFQNIIHCVELHGEKLKMKLWDNPSTEEFLSPSIKIAQGILLFYSVKSRKSYEKIQKDLSKIIELGRFDVPIILIGNHKSSPEREVTYEEAKTWADNYGLRFYETSLEKDGSIKQILQDIGEQLLFQECIFSANNSVIIKDDENDNDKDEIFNLEENLNIGSLIESKNKESDKKNKTEKIKEKRNSISYKDKEDILEKNYSSNNIFDKDGKNNIKNKGNNNKPQLKKKLFKTNSSYNLQKNKPTISTNRHTKEQSNLSKNNSVTILHTEHNASKKENTITKFLNYSKLNIINKTKNLFKKNPTTNHSKTSYVFHSKQNSVNSLNLSSSSNAHSYLKKTALTKNREKEIKEKKIKIEKELQTISAQKEREGLELKKRKNLEDKENYLKKIKEDKILQKEKEKKKKEEETQIAKNNYDKLKQEKELISQEKKIEKEKDKLNKIALKQSEKEKLSKRVEEINKEREKEIENMKMKKLKEKEKEKAKEEENEEKIKSSIFHSKLKKIQEKKNFSPNKHKKENSTFNLSFSSKFKSENANSIDKTKKENNKTKKDKENNKEKEITEKILSVKIDQEKEKNSDDKIKAKEEYKNNFINNQNNEDIYRCLKCNSIPQILFNENNQEIEVVCDHSNINNSHHNITSYQNFQTKSLDHSLYEYAMCYYCNRSLNKLEQNEMIYFCPFCEFWFCSNDEKIHINQKHQNEIDIKNKYKSILDKNTKKRRGSIELDSNKKIISNSIINSRRLSLKLNLGSGKQDLKNNDIKPQSQELKTIPQKDLIKIPIYLLDTFCPFHDETYNSYCHTCNKNICHECINTRHNDHDILNFEDIMLNEDELNKKKLELNMIKENLSKINEYFMALIEALKCRFERLYKAKQKEIEIKEKIIKDYEKIKYNYNSILNIKNLNLSNKQNFINTTNNTNLLERLNLIFEYLNSPLVSEKSNIFRDLYSSNKYNIENIYFNNEEIKAMIKLNNNDIALFNNKNELRIYNLDKFYEKWKINISQNDEYINHITLFKNGNLACCGYEHIKMINLDLYNQVTSINNIITEKKNNYLSLLELDNNYLITTDISKNIKLWNRNNKNIYSCLNILNNIEINLLYNIDNHSFIGYSNDDNKIIKYIVSKNKEILKQNEINYISIVNKSNSIIKYDQNYLLINYEENNKFGITIVKLDKFEILAKIASVIPFYYIKNYEKDKLITINKNGLIQKWNFIKSENKLYEFDKIKIFNDSFAYEKLRDFIEINEEKIVFQYKSKITLCSKIKKGS